MKNTDELLRNFIINKQVYEEISFDCSFYQSEIIEMPLKIDTYCNICRQNRTFKTTKNLSKGGRFGENPISRPKEEISYERLEKLDFQCTSCDEQIKSYYLHVEFKDGKLTIQKVGEFPRKELVREPVLDKFFDTDKQNYRKAEICLTHGLGIAAFAYYRRIIEKNIEKLVIIIKNDPDISNEMKVELNKLHNASNMKDRISVANKALPPYLIRDGINPLGRIYEFLSDGLHSDSDEVCLENAKHLKACILFIVKEITERNNNLKAFKSALKR